MITCNTHPATVRAFLSLLFLSATLETCADTIFPVRKPMLAGASLRWQPLRNISGRFHLPSGSNVEALHLEARHAVVPAFFGHFQPICGRPAQGRRQVGRSRASKQAFPTKRLSRRLRKAFKFNVLTRFPSWNEKMCAFPVTDRKTISHFATSWH